jgi:hypothetical protein
MNRIPAVFVSFFLFYITHPALCIGAATVINGDAEMGDLTGWIASPSGGVATDVLQWQYTVTPHEGDWFFSLARPASNSGLLEQTGTMEIGKGPVLRFSGIFQTEHGDFGEAVITLRDGDNVQVAQQTTARILSRDHRWETFSVDVPVPPTAASWNISLQGTLREGRFTNTYFDDIRLGILGDFNQDCELTIHDLEILNSAIQSTDTVDPKLDLDRLQFDLDRSGVVDPLDRDYWVTELHEAWIGDLNFDGEVNGLDVDPFVDVLLNGPYQIEADMNEDMEVNGLDVDPFVEAVVGGGVAAVPEPSTLLLCLIALGLVTRRRRWQRSA